MRIVIITPVRNEARYISTTIECMQSQTLKPVEWIIVNDGSTDNTERIIQSYLKENPFIKYLYLKDRGYRKPGKGVIEAFYKGFEKIGIKKYDVLTKLDGDLYFPPDTLEKIVHAFKSDPKLGITGGIRHEKAQNGKTLKKVFVPQGFVGGPFKFYRRQCFEDIGGLINRAGWDGVDLIKANMNGWDTYEIETLIIIHLRATGMARGEGLAKANEKYGDVSYYMGGYLWYFFLRVIGRSIINRNPRVGFYMIRGYFKAMMNTEARESSIFRNYLKKVQLNNIKNWVGILQKKLSTPFFDTGNAK